MFSSQDGMKQDPIVVAVVDYLVYSGLTLDMGSGGVFALSAFDSELVQQDRFRNIEGCHLWGLDFVSDEGTTQVGWCAFSKKLNSATDFLSFPKLEGNRVVGGASVRVMQFYEDVVREGTDLTLFLHDVTQGRPLRTKGSVAKACGLH